MAKSIPQKRGGVLGSLVDSTEPPIDVGEEILPDGTLVRSQINTFVQRLRKNALIGIERIIGSVSTQSELHRDKKTKEQDKKLRIVRSGTIAEDNRREATKMVLRGSDMLRKICEESSSILTNAELATKVLGAEGVRSYAQLNQGILSILNDRGSYVYQLLSELSSKPENATRIFSDLVLLAKSKPGKKITEITSKSLTGNTASTERMVLEQATACGILKLFYALWRTQNDQYIRVVRGFERHLTKDGAPMDILHYSFSDKDLESLCQKNPPGERAKIRKFYVALSQLAHRLRGISEDFQEQTGESLESASRLKTMESIIFKLLSKQEAEPYEIDDIIGAAFTVTPENIVTLYRLLKEYHLVEAMNTYGRQSRVEITKMMGREQLYAAVLKDMRIRIKRINEITPQRINDEAREFLADLGYLPDEINGYLEGGTRGKTTKPGVKSVSEDVGLTHFKTFFRSMVGVDERGNAWIESSPAHKLDHYQSYDLDKVEIRIRTPESQRQEEVTRDEFDKQRTLESLQRLFTV